jgi:hypothetical protein
LSSETERHILDDWVPHTSIFKREVRAKPTDVSDEDAEVEAEIGKESSRIKGIERSEGRSIIMTESAAAGEGWVRGE